MTCDLIESKILQRLNWQLNIGDDIKFASFEDDSEIDLSEALLALPSEDVNKISLLQNIEEARHFALRRAFQRCFLKVVFDFKEPLPKLPLQQQRDTSPICSLAPSASLSFSSSKTMAIAAMSATSKLGIDVEHVRPVLNALALAHRFFDRREALLLENRAALDLDTEFLKRWTIKEACLKAVGQGVIFGPEKFIVDSSYNVEPPHEFGTTENWCLKFPTISGHHVATLAIYRP